MRNLIQLIWKYHFVLLFLVVELISFFILVQNNSFHRANFLTSANEISGNAFKTINNVSQYLKLKKVNQALIEENVRLKSEAQTSFYSLTPDVRFFNDSAYLTQYEYLAAKAINNTTNKRSNYLTLNQGSRNELTSEMGVVSDKGVIGIIQTTSDNYSFVISLLHKDAKISERLKSSNYFGILTWDGRNPSVAQLDDIPAHVKINVGDSVITRGSGTIFPPNIMVGTIKGSSKIEGTDFQAIEINLSVDFNNVTYVYVVRNKLKMEQQELEKPKEED